MKWFISPAEKNHRFCMTPGAVEWHCSN